MRPMSPSYQHFAHEFGSVSSPSSETVRDSRGTFELAVSNQVAGSNCYGNWSFRILVPSFSYAHNHMLEIVIGHLTSVSL